MIETKDKIIIKFKTDNIADIIEDIKTPMSLNQIMDKYGVSYPFTVKCVKEFHAKKTGIAQGLVGRILTYYKDSNLINHANAKETIGNRTAEHKDSKKFLLWE